MHKRTLYSACVRLRVMRACANSRTRHTKTRLEATLSFRTLEMQLQFSLHAGLFTRGGVAIPIGDARSYNICQSQLFRIFFGSHFLRAAGDEKFFSAISAIKIGNIYIGIALPQAQRAGGLNSAAGEFFRDS